MLLKLSAPGLRPLGESSARAFLGRISERADRAIEERHQEMFLSKNPVDSLPPGFRAYLLQQGGNAGGREDVYVLGPEHRYLAEGDVVRVDPPRRSLQALYRRSSPNNAFLLTERCDNYCVMCSQPPNEQDDGWRIEELHSVLPLIARETPEIIITGGEPSLLTDRFVALIEAMKRHLPNTAVHILSNGRGFSRPELARALAAVVHPDLMVGIPVYSDLPEQHDYVVQARGAFDETILGILNLKRSKVRVEIRVVIHSGTYERLPELAQFISRNLRFVDHVALMGLEMMGFGKTNLEALWVDPLDYQNQLSAAVRTLKRARMRTSIYNHQLCVLPSELHDVARKSISDWKNRYFEPCDGCSLRESCGGFFASAVLKRSRGIAPVPVTQSPD